MNRIPRNMNDAIAASVPAKRRACLLGVLFTIFLAGLDNTIVSTVIPVALPELGGAHMYACTFAAYM